MTPSHQDLLKAAVLSPDSWCVYWSDPRTGLTALGDSRTVPVFHMVSVRDAIDLQRMSDRWSYIAQPENSDDVILLDDFIIVRWGTLMKCSGIEELIETARSAI